MTCTQAQLGDDLEKGPAVDYSGYAASGTPLTFRGGMNKPVTPSLASVHGGSKDASRPPGCRSARARLATERKSASMNMRRYRHAELFYAYSLTSLRNTPVRHAR